MKKYYSILVLLVFFSCKSQGNEENIALIDFSKPQLIDEDVRDWVQIENRIQLDIPDSISFGKVIQLEFTDSEILVLENGINSSVLVFDRQGAFKKQLLKLGNGPGEYFEIDFFILKENSILVYDRSSQKLIAYSLMDFSLLQEYKTKDYLMGGLGLLAEDRIFLVSDTEFEDGFYRGYEFLNSDLSELLIKPQFAGYIEAFLPQQISYSEDQPFLVQSFTDRVFRVGSDSLTLAYKFDFGTKKIPKEAIELTRAEDFYEILEKGSFYFAAHNLLISEKSIAFNFYNETIENLNFGLIDTGKAYRFLIDSDLKEVFLKPISVREGMFHTVLLPGEFDQEVGSILNITEFDYEKPILVSYHIGK